MRKENELLEAELAGIETDEVVPIEGVSIPIRTQTAGHKHRLSEHALDQMGAIKRMQGPTPKFSGKDLKELQDYEVKWLNKFSSSEMGGAYARIPDASRVALASGALDGLAAYQWSRKTPIEQKSYELWDDYISYLRTLVADPENRLAASTLALKECKQASGQTARELQQHIDELEGDIPKDMPHEQRRAYQLLNSLQPALRAHVLRQQEKVTSVENVLVIASRQEQLSALTPGQSRDEAKSSYSASSRSSSRRSVPSSRGGRMRERTFEKTREVQKSGSPGYRRGPMKCFNCGQEGHRAANCEQPRRTPDARVAHMASSQSEAVKDEGALKAKNSRPTL